jgi:hypothetical protein
MQHEISGCICLDAKAIDAVKKSTGDKQKQNQVPPGMRLFHKLPSSIEVAVQGIADENSRTREQSVPEPDRVPD